MLGSIVVRFMSFVLNIAGVLLIIAGTIAGTIMGVNRADDSPVYLLVGMVGGFVGSALFVVVTFGTAFLILEINNNLIRIAKLLKDSGVEPTNEKHGECDPTSGPLKQAIEAARRQAIQKTLLPSERMCGGCGAKYMLSDYDQTASNWACSTCKQPLPKG